MVAINHPKRVEAGVIIWTNTPLFEDQNSTFLKMVTRIANFNPKRVDFINQNIWSNENGGLDPLFTTGPTELDFSPVTIIERSNKIVSAN